MNPCARVLIAWAILGAGLPAVVPAAAKAQNLTARVLPNGTHTFRRMLFGSQLRPIKEFDELNDAPKKSLLIVFGDLRALDDMEATVPGGLTGFLREGGAVLVASDHAGEHGILQKHLGVYAHGAIVGNKKPGKAYFGQENCPYATVIDPRHPLFENVRSLATNAPTFLRGERLREYQRLARFPEGSTTQGVRENPLIFAIGNPGDQGKVLVLGGHGVFMNSMMDDWDNFTFAGNCIKWFTKKANRDRVLLIDEGRIIKNFNVPLVEIPLPPFPSIHELNELLRGLEKENIPNRALLSWLAQGESDEGFARARLWIFRGVLFLVALLAVIYGWRRLRRGLYRREVTIPLVVHSVAQTVPDHAAVDQRQQIMLHEGNLWEAARELARQCFVEYAGRFPHPPPPPPRVEVRAGWWYRRSLAKLVEQMWKLAYDSPARPVTPAEFREIAREADELKTALGARKVVLWAPAVTADLPVWSRAGGSPALS